MAKPRPKGVQYSSGSGGMPAERSSTCPAAADPYLELELYLEKVNEEIGAVFEHWQQTAGGREGATTGLRRSSEPANLATNHDRCYPDVVRQGGVGRNKQTRKASVPTSRAETNHLAEFERVVADELLALTPSPSDSSGSSTPSPSPYSPQQTDPTSPSTPGLPDLLSVQQHDLVSGTSKAAATSPVLKPKEVENFLRKVQHTILGEDARPSPPISGDVVTNAAAVAADANTIKEMPLPSKAKGADVTDTSGLDAGTQTQDLSRSSSFTWLSSSSLLDSPASASGSSGSSSAPSGASTRDESSAEDTSSSSEALLTRGAGVGPVAGSDSPDSWLRLRATEVPHPLASSSSEWATSAEPVWQPRLPTAGQPIAEASSRDGTASDNDMPNQRKRKYHAARAEESDTGQQAQQSPSLSSLRAVGTPLAPELATKSSSVPVLAKQPPHAASSTTSTFPSGGGQSDKTRNFAPVRSQSERHLSEIEAAEACRWMRAAGFPQYAQMYEDLQFPVDMNSVQKDHPFLDRDALQALFRRLHVLNKCARLRVDGGALAKNPVDDSDEEVECALSDNWTFLHQSRRWSRVSPLTECPLPRPQQQQQSQDSQNTAEEVPGAEEALCAVSNEEEEEEEEREEREGAEEDEDEGGHMSDHMAATIPVHPLRQYSSLPPGRFRTSGASDSEFSSPQTFRRSGSEKLRDGAKAFLRRVESLKTRGKKQKHTLGKGDDCRVIGKPQVIDVAGMQERMRSMNCVDVMSPGASPSEGLVGDAESCKSAGAGTKLLLQTLQGNVDTSPQHTVATVTVAATAKPTYSCVRRPSKDLEDTGTQSDTDCLQWNSEWRLQEGVVFEKDANSNNTKLGVVMSNSEPRRRSSRKRSQEHQQQLQKAATLQLDTSKNKHKPSSRYGKSDSGGLAEFNIDKDDVRPNTYDNINRSPFTKSLKEPLSRGYSDVSVQEDDSTTSGSRQKSCVMRWHSFGRGSRVRQPSFSLSLPVPVGTSSASAEESVALTFLSCGQLMVLRQLAMLKLTALMEKHCPALRSTGFSWELPKFMKKCKSPHNKDQTMFGVSLLSSLQQTGYALPPAIQAAIQHLSEHALDRVGLFRKPGVRSRIQKLRTQLINTGLNQPLELTLEEQQAYDVADVVKQFFRELPEALLTSKLSDTFLAIFQYVPVSSRHEAMKWAILLLPDQHREVLQCLLSFLNLVASNSHQNQMTASNLAVCLAPSLFHSSPSPSPADTSLSDSQRSASPRSRSKRRTKSASAGSPDAKELTESRAAHDCLLYLINHNEDLVTISQDLLLQCHFSSMEQSIPVPLGELGSDMGQDWKGYMHACTTALLKEARERQRGWVTVTSPDTQVELAYKKVGDGHPLRIWRVSTEVEAPPAELLHRILREQHMWDPTLIKWRVLSQPEQLSEVYHYVCASMTPLPPRDYCVLRSWRSDLPRGGCVLVETSVEYPGSNELAPQAVRAIVLASRYLLEPCGSGRSRVLHLSRIDTKGRSVEWYNKCYGHTCALNLTRMRASFSHAADGPESKV